MKTRIAFAVVAIAAIAAVSAPAALASHSWGSYHWARQSNPFTIKLGDNVSGLWDGMLVTASNDWKKSKVLDTTIVDGGTDPKRCNPTLGQVEVCSYNYGGQQWLGVATIWISGEHILQGTVKNNDFYFGASPYQYRYNNTPQMQHVICQEIGHTFGLDHQDETGISLDTCMDYYHNTSASDTQSTHPNEGDYDQLLCIYDPATAGDTLTSRAGHTCTGTGHLDSTTTVGAAAFSPFASGHSWKFGTRLAGGVRKVSFVTWVGL